MKTLAKRWFICLAVSLLAAGGRAFAVSHSVLPAALLPMAAAAQTEAAAIRFQVDDLLRRARQAMRDGNFDLADWYLKRAEATGVQYDDAAQSTVDTPSKVRRDLQALRDPRQVAQNQQYQQRSAATAPGAPSARDGDRLELSRELFPADELPNATDSAADLAEPVPGVAWDYTQRPEPFKAGSSDSNLNRFGSLRLPSRFSQLGPPQDTADSKLQVVNNPYANGNGPSAVAAGVVRPSAPPAQVAVSGAQPIPTQLPPQAQATSAPGMERSDEIQQARRMLARSKAALDRGDIEFAELLVHRVSDMQLPDRAFQSNDLLPWVLMMEINKERQRSGAASQADGAGRTIRVSDAATRPAPNDDSHVANALAQQSGTDRAVQAQALSDATVVAEEPQGPQLGAETIAGMQLFKQAEEELKKGNGAKARELFRDTWAYEQHLDPEMRQRLQDYLVQLPAPQTLAPEQPVAAPLKPVDPEGDLAVRRLYTAVTREQAVVDRMREDKPKEAWQRLQDLREQVAEAELDASAQQQLLSRVDRSIEVLGKYIDENRAQIELDERNTELLAELDRRRQLGLDVQNKLAEMVEEFNGLMDQQRYSEAVVKAKQARELDANNPVVQNMLWKSRFAERMLVEFSFRERGREGASGAIGSVLESSIPFDDRRSIEFPDAKIWDELSSTRKRFLEKGGSRFSEAELAIQQSLRKLVEVRFDNQPLSQVMDALAKMAGVNVYLDPQGLAAEGITTDTPISINLTHEVSLRSALNLVLQPLRLGYVIQNEVLHVTSEQTREADVYNHVYNVADLVIPIPNFIPSYNIGLPGAIREAHNALGYGMMGGAMNQAPLAVVAGSEGMGGGTNASVLAQMGSAGMLPSASRSAPPGGIGPGGLGGGVQADFDTLIELITATIAPTTWDEVGGPGSIAGFDTNLSLVVSQTQEVHEEIVDLLEQLRRLQDLQVTIEVRFITLNDNFFERIGIDFDFDIDDNTAGLPPDDSGPSVTIGLDPTGQPTADLDISFTQDSFGAAVPAFGGFDAGTAANFGFAILSDIEAFFVIQAAQGDNRTNVLQAPKVTLFNGQQAFVSDTSQRPFVTSVIPVVGDFAAAHQPVIVVLTEGTSLSVQAVVSNDRRFVRLTLVPFFSKIGAVQEFTFNGKRSSTTGTTAVDPSDGTQVVQNDAQDVIEGTTVQLPTFAFTTVTTTVSVPDGGTILLGGIKRLSEGRNERGVPMLSKLPYVNRLFKNVGIGRTTQSLMMMVTPRIIIQEEEEEKLGIAAP